MLDASAQEKWPRPKGFAAEGHWFFVQMQAEENIPSKELEDFEDEHLDLGKMVSFYGKPQRENLE